jgi:hypothetical protein
MMKKTILTKMVLLLVVFSFSTTSKAQTDSLANLFYQNVQTSNNVLRFEDNALASVRFTNGSLTDNLQYYLRDESGATIYPKQTNNTWNEVLFENLVLDVDYSIHTSFQGEEYIVGSFHTRDNSLKPFEASENLFNALETWYEIPQETRPEAGSFLLQNSTIPFFESVAYLQALYDMPFLPNSLLQENSEANIIDIWVDYGDPIDSIPTHTHLGDEVYEETLNFKPLDPSTIDKCICQYTLKTEDIEDFRTTYIDKEYNYGITNHSKRHFQLGKALPKPNSDTYEHIKDGFAGPAKSVEYTLKGYKTDKTIRGNDGGLTADPASSTGEHYAGIKMKLFCEGLPQKILSRLLLVYSSEGEEPDLSFLTPTPAEECLCSKQVEICWRYDADIYAQAKEGGCDKDNKAAITVQDYVEVTLQQGSSAKQVLRSANSTLKAKCNADHIEKNVKVAELAAKNQELISLQAQIDAESDPTKKAILQAQHAVKLAEFLAKNGEIEKVVNDCGSDNGLNQLPDECRQITLQSNQTTYFRMNNGYKIDAEGKDCFFAIANIKSDFYITAIMEQPNVTPNDVEYCCSKKWGKYFLASFPGAPMSRQQAKVEVGDKFSFAGTWDAPYTYLATNPVMVHDMDVLTGGIRCDDVIFNSSRVSNDENNIFYEVQIQFSGLNTVQLMDLPSEENAPNTQIVITDMMGKILLNTSSSEQTVSFSNLPLRKGVYFVSLISGNSFKTFKILNYE